jgi:large subunit ribosomal protein L24
VDIRKGDTVIVLSGSEKGKIGRVLYIFPEKRRVIIEKINMIKRHQKPRSQGQMQSGIIEKEAAMPLSKVALYDPKAKRGTRVRYRVRIEKEGTREIRIKERISARTGEVLEKPAPKST